MIGRRDARRHAKERRGAPAAPEGTALRGVVLAGAYGRQGSALDRACPRPLLPVALLPLVCYPIRWLERGGVRRVTVCENRPSYLVRNHLGDGARLGVRIDYFEDWVPRGVAGCLRDATRDAPDELVIAVEGAVIPHIDLERLVDAHVRSGAALTVVVDSAGRESAEPERALAPAGAYVVSPAALRMVADVGFQDLKETLIPRLYDAGLAVRTFAAAELCPRVLDARSYLAVDAWVLERYAHRRVQLRDHDARDEAWVHATATVDSEARLVGPVLVGPGARIGAGAVIVGPASIGPDVAIGREAVVSRSVLWAAASVGARALVDRSLVGAGVEVSAGTVLTERLELPLELRAPRPPAALVEPIETQDGVAGAAAAVAQTG